MNWKKISKKQEKFIAKKIGGKRHVGSGCWFEKADVSNSDVLGEAKLTEKEYFSITMKVLNKLEDQAMGIGKEPRLYIRFLTMPPLFSKDWELIPVKDYLDWYPALLTDKKSFRISIDMLQKLETKARERHNAPIIYIRFENMSGLYTKSWQLKPLRENDGSNIKR